MGGEQIYVHILYIERKGIKETKHAGSKQNKPNAQEASKALQIATLQ